MKIKGELVDMLLKLDPYTFKLYVVHEKGQNLICVVVLRAINGMLVA